MVILFFIKRKILWIAPLVSTAFAFIAYMISFAPVSIVEVLSNNEWRRFFLLAMLMHIAVVVRDCFISDENPEVSNVNGTPVIIYGYDNMYMINFSYEGINYDIETKDMGLDQLQALLTNIIS